MAIPSIAQLLDETVKAGSSDLHLSAGMPPMIRVDGDMQRMDHDVIDDVTLAEMIRGILTERQRHSLETDWELDLSLEVKDVARFRVNCFQQRLGMGAVFRVIPTKVLSLEDLKFGDIFRKLSDYHNGLVLVTGPTGSGKTTTLAAMLNYINETKPMHILSAEDPIEFTHQSKMSLINQREVHRDTKSFNAALRAALREDPDVILVGELRDLETIRLALTAAETGHLVFGTLHTSSATKTIDRIIDVFPAEEKDMIRSMLSESLRGVITQTLLKKIGGGRIAAHEIMVSNNAIRNLIRENKIAQMYSAIQTGQQWGMQTLEQHLEQLIADGKITMAQAAKKCGSKKFTDG